MNIVAGDMHFRDLNEKIRNEKDKKIRIKNCVGQRYIGSGLGGKEIVIEGVPGNALGAYLNGSIIRTNGNVQDATGDTMNGGAIYVHGSSGDATGYAMRGGKIFVKGDTGYRAGIHIKAYEEHKPTIIIGGAAGSFLGEYQAGGNIVVLGLNSGGKPPVGYFCGTGMHGGKIYLRCDILPHDLPAQVSARDATPEDMEEIDGDLSEFCKEFQFDKKQILKNHFFVLTANTKNPYKQLYTQN